MIQNFKRRSRINRWTPKKNLIWLLNNVSTFYLITVQIYRSQWLTLTTLTKKHILQLWFKEGFKETLVHKTIDSLIFRNYPVGISFNETLKYWILRSGLSLVEGGDLSVRNISYSRQLRFNQYYTFRPFLLTRSTQKTLKIFLTKFFTLLPLTWVQWNGKHRIKTQHTFLLKEFHIFKFLNVYFFKVFNF